MHYNLLFVYGTLREGGHLHHRYMKNLVKSLDITIKGIKLYFVNYVPVAVITHHNKNKIMGELYYVTNKQMKRIDRLEMGYNKILLNLTIDGFETKQDVIMYAKTMKDIPKYAIRIKHGDFIKFDSFEDDCDKQFELEDKTNYLNDYDEINESYIA